MSSSTSSSPVNRTICLCFGNQCECTARASLSPFKYIRGIRFSALVYMYAGVMRLHLPVYVRVYRAVSVYWLCPVWFVRQSENYRDVYMLLVREYIHRVSQRFMSGLLQCRNVAEITRIIIKGLGGKTKCNFLTREIIYCTRNLTCNRFVLYTCKNAIVIVKTLSLCRLSIVESIVARVC